MRGGRRPPPQHYCDAASMDEQCQADTASARSTHGRRASKSGGGPAGVAARAHARCSARCIVAGACCTITESTPRPQDAAASVGRRRRDALGKCMRPRTSRARTRQRIRAVEVVAHRRVQHHPPRRRRRRRSCCQGIICHHSTTWRARGQGSLDELISGRDRGAALHRRAHSLCRLAAAVGRDGAGRDVHPTAAWAASAKEAPGMRSSSRFHTLRPRSRRPRHMRAAGCAPVTPPSAPQRESRPFGSSCALRSYAHLRSYVEAATRRRRDAGESWSRAC